MWCEVSTWYGECKTSQCRVAGSLVMFSYNHLLQHLVSFSQSDIPNHRRASEWCKIPSKSNSTYTRPYPSLSLHYARKPVTPSPHQSSYSLSQSMQQHTYPFKDPPRPPPSPTQCRNMFDMIEPPFRKRPSSIQPTITYYPHSSITLPPYINLHKHSQQGSTKGAMGATK